jgi:hypothetical protein
MIDENCLGMDSEMLDEIISNIFDGPPTATKIFI